MPQLAIAIVHYHAEQLLRRCLEVLRDSSYQNFVVSVVDNGSQSGLPWVETIDARFRVVSPGRNIGFAAGTNMSLQNLPARTPYVLLLNPDVILEPNTLAEMIGVLERTPEIGAATCKLVRPSGALDPACHRSEPTLLSALFKQTGLQAMFPSSRVLGRYNLTYIDPDTPHDIDSGTAAFLMLRRSALNAIGGTLDERFFLYGEDLDLCRRIRAAQYRVHYWPHVTATHVKGSGRVRHRRATLEFHRAMWTYYRKWGRFQGNGFVLVPVIGAIVTLTLLELLRNAIRLWQTEPLRVGVPPETREDPH